MEKRDQEIMEAVANIISFIKQSARKDISEAKNRKIVTLSDDEAKKIGNIIEQSIETSFLRSTGLFSTKELFNKPIPYFSNLPSCLAFPFVLDAYKP